LELPALSVLLTANMTERDQLPPIRASGRVQSLFKTKRVANKWSTGTFSFWGAAGTRIPLFY